MPELQISHPGNSRCVMGLRVEDLAGAHKASLIPRGSLGVASHSLPSLLGSAGWACHWWVSPDDLKEQAGYPESRQP